jgi:dTDP-4-dehydrorhamnose reductase
MIWLIGNRGMLGTEVESLLCEYNISHIVSGREADITDYNALKVFIESQGHKKIDWIINCAAYTDVDRAEDEPEVALRVNSIGVRNIAKVAQMLSSVMVHLSTDYVFNGKKESEYTEGDEPEPLGAYGRSKLEGERRVVESLKRYYILRTAWLYGSNGRNFVNTMLRLFREREAVDVVADQFGSPTYAKDLAEFILFLVRRSPCNYGLYHFTNLDKASRYEFAREIYEIGRRFGLLESEVMIRTVSSSEYPSRAVRPQNSYLSKEKILRTFGISIRKWQDALKDYLEEIAGERDA